jgi:hypothetical protein
VIHGRSALGENDRWFSLAAQIENFTSINILLSGLPCAVTVFLDSDADILDWFVPVPD